MICLNKNYESEYEKNVMDIFENIEKKIYVLKT